ncbi:hypothetical protein SteCoe_26649 [Stentor coeruleus]|uniref:Uncharacterized protein n=1 Tax=Stentor coeruleus TaxID=5963 RepID=A0A1R2BCC9_9CILI|nr:hypothetical protein SteCoe_26649 [Stentor coeruleus]
MNIRASGPETLTRKVKNKRKTQVTSGRKSIPQRSRTERNTLISPKNSKKIKTGKRISNIFTELSTETSNNTTKYTEKTKKVSSQVLDSLKLLKTVSSDFINTNKTLHEDVQVFKHNFSILRTELTEAIEEKNRSKLETTRIRSMFSSPERRSSVSNTFSAHTDRKLSEDIYSTLCDIKDSMKSLEKRLEFTEEMIRNKIRENDGGMVEGVRIKKPAFNAGLVIEDHENLVFCRACSIF